MFESPVKKKKLKSDLNVSSFTNLHQKVQRLHSNLSFLLVKANEDNDKSTPVSSVDTTTGARKTTGGRLLSLDLCT